MEIPAALLAALAVLKNKLVRPKTPVPLDDHGFRLKNILSKNQNVIIINNVEGDQYHLADLSELPDAAIQALKDNFAVKPASQGIPEIRLVKSEFQERILDYERFYGKEESLVDGILPYLRPDYASILKLASYVKSKYDAGENAEADRLKTHLGDQYGKNGRRLCNLYTSGYIPDAISEYMASFVGQTVPSEIDRTEICTTLNTLISKIIDFSENIHFIHRGTDVAVTRIRVINAMKAKKPYIALHSAGSPNIAIAEEIVSRIDKEEIERMGYEVTQGFDARIPSVVPFFDVQFTPRRQ